MLTTRNISSNTKSYNLLFGGDYFVNAQYIHRQHCVFGMTVRIGRISTIAISLRVTSTLQVNSFLAGKVFKPLDVRPNNRSSIPNRDKRNLSSLKASRDDLRLTQTPTQLLNGTISLVVKRPGCEAGN